MKTAIRLLHAIVDVLSSKSALAPCLLAMEMCQMVTQAMHVKDPLLLQLPGVSRGLAEKCEREGERLWPYFPYQAWSPMVSNLLWLQHAARPVPARVGGKHSVCSHAGAAVVVLASWWAFKSKYVSCARGGAGVEDIVALEEMDEAARRSLLALPDDEYQQVVTFCQRYPDIVLEFTVLDGTDVTPEGEDTDAAKVFEVAGDAQQVRNGYAALRLAQVCVLCTFDLALHGQGTRATMDSVCTCLLALCPCAQQTANNDCT